MSYLVNYQSNVRNATWLVQQGKMRFSIFKTETKKRRACHHYRYSNLSKQLCVASCFGLLFGHRNNSNLPLWFVVNSTTMSISCGIHYVIRVNCANPILRSWNLVGMNYARVLYRNERIRFYFKIFPIPKRDHVLHFAHSFTIPTQVDLQIPKIVSMKWAWKTSPYL